MQKALETWREAGRPQGLVRIADSGTYGGALRIELPDNGRLAIEAADGTRPTVRLVGDLTVAGSADGAAALVLNGLLVEGGIRLQGSVDLTVTHCTLLPGRMAEHDGARTFPARPAVAAEGGAAGLAVNVSRSIVGGLRLPAEGVELVVSDSVIGLPTTEGAAYAAIAGPEGGSGPATTLERATVFGPVSVPELVLASEMIFTAPVTAERRETGCVRFSYLPEGSRTPPRFRCQPELALAQAPEGDRTVVLARLEPRFTSVSYGDPAFAQLAEDCAAEIRTGAEDDSEMGAFHHLQQTQRETNLRGVLDDYVPVRLEVGLFFLT